MSRTTTITPAARTSPLAILPLLEALRDHADDPVLYELLDEPTDEREFFLLQQNEDYQLWLISWPPGSATGWHDHGSAAGAYTVLTGSLVEQEWDGSLQLTDVGPGDARAYAAGHVHNVKNASGEPVLSLHAYSPRLDAMNSYVFRGDRVELVAAEPGR
jgi:quercetin dioxygenase-like cupin family protein